MLKRLFRSNRQSVSEDVHTEEEFSGRPAPFTAREALAAISPGIGKLDGQFRLVQVISHSDIGPDGRSMRWEFLVDLPALEAEGLWVLEPCSPEGYENPGRWCIRGHARSIYQGILQLQSQMRADPRSIEYLRRDARERAKARKSLPLDFIDSPEAVGALAEKGADWITGDGHMTLSTDVRPDGKGVWHTFCWDIEYSVPLSKER